MAQPTRVALVTGATAGIGRETARGLARAGYRVVLTGRDPRRLEETRRAVAALAGRDAEPHAVLADFASLAAVRALAETVLAHDRLDVLVNNAGLIAPHRQRSADGYELTIAINHLAPFLLTNLLLDRLRAAAEPHSVPRIVTVASQAHRGARLDPAVLAEPAPPDWSPLRAYGRSKLCNILFTRALARRLDGGGVVAACLHPGVVATAIGDSAGLAGLGWRLVKPFLISPEKGAATSLLLATMPDPRPFHGAYVIGNRTARPDPAALDDALAEHVWRESARLVGLSPGLAPR